MKALRLISRLLVGIVFIFSGFVKAVDPWGSAFKFHDYFLAFGMEWLIPLAFWLGILLCLFEFVIGFALVFNVKMKLAAWGVMLFMSFFTLLTFYLALENPVSDCGCFGDAIIMTNWQTFYKNIFLMIFTLIIFIGRNKYVACKNIFYELSVIGISTAILLGISYYSYSHLPLIDFMPWKVGNKISTLVVGSAEISEVTLVYKHKQTEELYEYTTKTLPFNDSILWANLEFVEQKKNVIKEYEEPPIKDFFIRDTLNDDYTIEFINNPEFQFLFVSYNINKIKFKNIEKIIPIHDSCYANDVSFAALSGSSPADVYKVLNENNIDLPMYFVDETALKSVVRANPGLVLLYNGVVVDKWHYNDFPEWADFVKKQQQYKEISEKGSKL